MHADRHRSFYKLALTFLMEVDRHVQSTQKRKFVVFLQYIKRKLLQLLDAKHSDILWESSHVRCYFFFFELIEYHMIKNLSV